MHTKSIRKAISTHAKLKIDVSDLDDDSDLYNAGLTSLNTVNLMLEIEDHFDIEFDDDSLNRETFQSVSSLANVVTRLINTRGSQVTNPSD